MMKRSRWQGMLTIAQLNWPFYAAAALATLAASGAIALTSQPGTKLACGLAAAGAGYFLLISLAVSHLVYDRSELYRWSWLPRATGNVRRGDFVLCHGGFDETSASLRQRFFESRWIILDHFDPRRMTEPSIRRARRRFPPGPGTRPAPFDRWPIETGSADVVLALLAIHELRSEAERSAWFAEARRCLRPHGRVILAEHVRDTANFLAFGPGAFHFHSPESWRRCWARAGLRAIREFRVTPWVRVFVLVPA
jgi:SAM-dependent methyltransferase